MNEQPWSLVIKQIEDGIFKKNNFKEFLELHYPDHSFDNNADLYISNEICRWGGLITDNLDDFKRYEKLEPFECFDIDVSEMRSISYDEFSEISNSAYFITLYMPFEYEFGTHLGIEIYPSSILKSEYSSYRVDFIINNGHVKIY